MPKQVVMSFENYMKLCEMIESISSGEDKVNTSEFLANNVKEKESSLTEVFDLICKSHGWRNHIMDFDNKKIKFFKYVDFCLDTRDNEIWNISFRLAGEKIKSFKIDTKEDFDKVIKWLESEEK